MVPDGWLEPFFVFEFDVSVFDCDMMSDHRNEGFAQEVAKALRRRIGALVVQFGQPLTRLILPAATALPLAPSLQRKRPGGFFR